MLRDRLITGDSSQDKVLAHCNTTCIYRSSCEAKLQSVRATSRQLVHQRVLAAGNITGINADEAERLQMPDQAPVTAANRRTPFRWGINGCTALNGVG